MKRFPLPAGHFRLCGRWQPRALHVVGGHRLGQDARIPAKKRRRVDGDVFLTGTELAGRFVLRACIVNFRTTEQDLEVLIKAVRVAGGRVRAQGVASGPIASPRAGVRECSSNVVDRRRETRQPRTTAARRLSPAFAVSAGDMLVGLLFVRQHL